MEWDDIFKLVALLLSAGAGIFGMFKKSEEKKNREGRPNLTRRPFSLGGDSAQEAESSPYGGADPLSPSPTRDLYDLFDEFDRDGQWQPEPEVDELPDEGICTVPHEPKRARASTLAYAQAADASVPPSPEAGDATSVPDREDPKIRKRTISSKRDLILYSAIMQPKYDM